MGFLGESWGGGLVGWGGGEGNWVAYGGVGGGFSVEGGEGEEHAAGGEGGGGGGEDGALGRVSLLRVVGGMIGRLARRRRGRNAMTGVFSAEAV